MYHIQILITRYEQLGCIILSSSSRAESVVHVCIVVYSGEVSASTKVWLCLWAHDTYTSSIRVAHTRLSAYFGVLLVEGSQSF